MKNVVKNISARGVSLIILVVTIIIILLLVSAIILSVSNTNPVNEANNARYENDCANMQAVFTNAVAKVTTRRRATVIITPGKINNLVSGSEETEGIVEYTLKGALNVKNKTGKIIFGKGTDTETDFYTGKALPIYAAGDTKWYVDSEGNISLEVAGIAYGN